MTEQNFTGSPDARHVSLADGLTALAGRDPASLPSAGVFTHGSLLVKLYAPRGTDAQTPHTRDELYVVARGRGMFRNGESRHAFGEGDVLFVSAGTVHRFEEFSDDLLVWVVFYGPEGGE